MQCGKYQPRRECGNNMPLPAVELDVRGEESCDGIGEKRAVAVWINGKK